MAVRPVLVFPGWYVIAKGCGRVWVLNPKTLSGWLNNERASLGREQIALYADRIRRHAAGE